MSITREQIDQIMHSNIADFAEKFGQKYTKRGSGLKNLANKVNNPFILALGDEIVIYSALMRSLDSSLGNRLEAIARDIAEVNYDVKDSVEGNIPRGVDEKISSLVNEYRDKKRTPQTADLEQLTGDTTKAEYRRQKSDYHLVKKSDDRQHFLLELKLGGDLDGKKASAEKRALLTQYAILKHSLQMKYDSTIQIYFATAYNKLGDEEVWKQASVLQYFSKDELLIGRDFWNFICDSSEGNTMVLETYRRHAPLLKNVLENIIQSARKRTDS